jgi:hypothetical protein
MLAEVKPQIMKVLFATLAEAVEVAAELVTEV